MKKDKNAPITVWQDHNEFYELAKRVEEKAESDEWVATVDTDFRHYWNAVQPYFTREKEVHNHTELERCAENTKRFVALMIIVSYMVEVCENVSSTTKEAFQNIREEVADYVYALDDVFRSFFPRFFQSDTELLPVILPQEVAKLQNGTLTEEEKENIKRRNAGAGILNGDIFLKSALDNKLLERNMTLVEGAVEDDQNVLYGQSANGGRVRGIARIVMRRNDMDKVEINDVLVAPMTTPDLLPAMKRAAAFVTDEGGVMSHAAIVSRELGKPCVIGTQNASDTLKDGDEIEVDADKGIITIVQNRSDATSDNTVRLEKEYE